MSKDDALNGNPLAHMALPSKALSGDDDRRVWLAGLKAGDQVAVVDRQGSIRLEYVKRRTPKGIVASYYNGEVRLNLDGKNWVRHKIIPVTLEITEEWHRQTLLKRIMLVRFHSLSTRTLIEIDELVKKPQRTT